MFDTATLRGRLTLAYAGALMLALVVFAIGTLVAFDALQRSLLDSELGTVASAEASTLELAGDGTIEAPDRQRFASIAGRHVASAVVTSGGRTLIASMSDLSETIARVAAAADHSFTTTLTDRGENVRATFVPVTHAGRRIATIAVWSNVEVIETLDRKLGIVFALAIPFFGVLATLAGSMIARRGLRPLERIVTEASHIDADDMRARVSLPRTTELARLATTLNGMLQRLNAAFERERRFTSDASHELRAPLAIILAETDLALARERQAPVYRRALEIIAIEAGGLEKLTSDLLATARATASDSAPTLLVVDLTDVAASVAARARPLAALRELTIRTALEHDAFALGDTGRIEQAMLTIVHNAIRYARSHGTLAVELEVHLSEIELRVSDDGPGFSEAALAHAFDRFWHESARDADDIGHGLGLAIARSTIERYGGTIALANRREGGAVVTVRFPKA